MTCGLVQTLVLCAIALTLAAPAHAVATVAADTTRSQGGDPLAAGRSTSLTAGGGDQALLRFSVRGLGGPPARALLRLRVTAATVENLAVRALPPAFGEDDGTPASLAPSATAVAEISGAKAGTWAEWDVTSAVQGDGEVGLLVGGPVVDPASFSSREGPDAPQLVVTPDDASAVKLAGLLDALAADTFVGHARDDAGSSLDALDVIAAPPGQGVPGRYIGVHHTLVGGQFVLKLATSDDLTTWRHRADLDSHASQGSIAALPDGGFVVALERDTPDPQYVSRSNLVVRHYAGWAALAAGQFDRDIGLPRTLAETAEGTPALDVRSWNGPEASEIAISFHYLKNISVDRQAAGVLTNFDAASWAPQPDAAVNNVFIGLGTRGNLGDRADLLFEGHRFAVLEAQSVKTNFATWRWFVYDRDRNEARLLAWRAPSGSYALGNPTVRILPGAASAQRVLLFTGYLFSQGAGPGEAGQFIGLRALPPDPSPSSTPVPVVPLVLGANVPQAQAPVRLPSSPPIADQSAPSARLSGATQKLATKIALGISCSDEDCEATTTGSVRVPELRGSKARTYRLPASTRTITEGRKVTLHVRVSSAARKAIARALRARKKVVASFRVKIMDEAGNARTLTRQLRLRL